MGDYNKLEKYHRTNDYFNFFSIDFENPLSTTMVGIIELHNYVIFFLLLTLLLVVVMFFFAVFYSKIDYYIYLFTNYCKIFENHDSNTAYSLSKYQLKVIE